MDRKEHPKPQFERENWINLNGKWKFAFDFSLTGRDKNWQKNTEEFKDIINVPFCPESSLSGVEYKDFINGIWYTRDITVPNEWKNGRVFIHFGGCDYETAVYINGNEAGIHYGGGVSFCFDITDFLTENINKLVVYVKDTAKKDDRSRSGQQRGKQSDKYNRYGCLYTRVTGIWQTVWLEMRPKAYIDYVRCVSDFDNSLLTFVPVFKNIKYGDKFKITVRGNGAVSEKECFAQSGVPVSLEMKNFVPWTHENPFLYDIEYRLVSDSGCDKVKSYQGMRKISVVGNKFYLNNEEIFLRFVLDQGYYPDGIWTAPSDEALKNDIVLSMEAGFNGARLHQKVFEERFLYHADRLGYLVWAENYDWGIGWDNYYYIDNLKNEWTEEVLRDANHPCIIAWTPFNETSDCLETEEKRRNNNRYLKEIYELTHILDPTRPVNDTSGYVHSKTDIYTIHDYEQNPDILKERYSKIEIGKKYEWKEYNPVCRYEGQPFVIDEYGGPMWAPDTDEDDTWGYSGNKNIEEVYDKIEKLTRVLSENEQIAGFCYTQLTDVEQEKNGIYKYNREKKFDTERIKKAIKNIK